MAEIYRLNSFVFESGEDNNGITLIIRNLADTWQMRVSSLHPLHYFWIRIIAEAKGSLSTRNALEATITLIYQMSNIGLHDAMLTNELVQSLASAQERITRILNGMEAMRTREEKEEDEKDDREWAQRAITLQEMHDGQTEVE